MQGHDDRFPEDADDAQPSPDRSRSLFDRLRRALAGAPLLTLASLWIPFVDALQGSFRVAATHFAVHLLRHQAVRMSVRFFVGMISLFLGVLLGFVSLLFATGDRPPPTLEVVTGTFDEAGFGREDRFVIFLAEHQPPFELAVSGRRTFDPTRFLRDTGRGDPVLLRVRRSQTKRPPALRHFVYGIEAKSETFLAPRQVFKAHRDSNHAMPIMAVLLLLVGALGLWDLRLFGQLALIISLLLGFVFALGFVVDWLG